MPAARPSGLYAALLAQLRIGHSAGEAGKGGGGLLELSEGARLQQANLEVVQSYGTNLLEVLARDATTGHDVRWMLALAVLDELVGLDRQAVTTIRFFSCQGFLKHLVESLAADQAGLGELLTKPGGNVRYLYVFEAKLGLLVRAASHPAGAELLLQAGLMARLAELSLSLRPDLDTPLLQQSGKGGALQRYHAVLFPVLRLCFAVLASLGRRQLVGSNAGAAVPDWARGDGLPGAAWRHGPRRPPPRPAAGARPAHRRGQPRRRAGPPARAH